VLHAQDTFPGTLFRLPLRGEATAASSDIKPSPTSLEEAQQLLAALQEQLPAAMLFLKSVQEVEVQVLDRNTSDAPQLLFRATATPLDGEFYRSFRPQCPVYSCLCLCSLAWAHVDTCTLQ
jgi:sacsin